MGFTGLRIGADRSGSDTGSLFGNPHAGARSGEFSPDALVRQILTGLPDLPPDTATNLRALTAERDPEMFFDGLLAVGRSLEGSEHPEAASVVFAAVAENAARPAGSGEDRLLSFRTRARTRLDAIEGVGAVAPRSEYLLRHLARQAIDPSMIVGMAAAGTAYRLTRMAVLSRLAATPLPSLLTRGFGARLAAASLGFLAEAPVFTASVRGANLMLGRSQDWSPEAVWTEFAGGATTLFCLKITGALGGAALRRFNRGLNPAAFGLARRSATALLPQASTFAGILAGHKLEESFGFREAHDGATFLTDGLATLLQFHVGGRLSHHAMGERFHASEREMERQGEALEGLLAPPAGSGAITWLPSWPRLRHFGRNLALAPLWMMMGVGGGFGSGRPPFRDTEPMNPGEPAPPVESPRAPEAAPPPPGRIHELPRFRRRVVLDDATLERMERFPEFAQKAHERSGEPNPVFFGLNSLKWWIGLIRRDAGDIGAQAIVHGGRILFGRFQENEAAQSALEARLNSIAGEAEIELAYEAPSLAEWWRPLWARAVENPQAGHEIPAALIRRVRAADPALAEEWLLDLAARDFDRSEALRDAAELADPAPPTVSLGSEAVAALREAVAAENFDRANALIGHLYSEAWHRPLRPETVEDIHALGEAVRAGLTNRKPISLTPPPVLTGRPEEDFPAWLGYAERILDRNFRSFPKEAQVCFLLARERIARSLGWESQADHLFRRAERINAGLPRPLPEAALHQISLAGILTHFDFYPPHLHHVFLDFHELARSGRAEEAVERLTAIYSDTGHLIFSLARIARSARGGGHLHLFHPRALERPPLVDLIVQELHASRAAYESPKAGLVGSDRYSALASFQDLSASFRSQAESLEELERWARVEIEKLRPESRAPHNVIQMEAGLIAGIDGTLRYAKEGRWHEAFAKIGEFKTAQARLTLLHIIIRQARADGLIAPSLSGLEAVPRLTVPQDRAALRNKLVDLAYRFGRGLEERKFENAERFSFLDRTLEILGNGDAAKFYRDRAQACAFNNTVVYDPQGQPFNSAFAVLRRHGQGEWDFTQHLSTEHREKVEELVRVSWDSAHDYILNYFEQGLASAYVEPMLAYLAALFVKSLSAESAAAASPIAVPGEWLPRFNFDTLTRRDREEIPEEHRHFIPEFSADHVHFLRFRRALDELASLVQAPDRIAIRLFGPPGTGKTTLPEIIAGRLGVPLLRFPISKRTDPSDFDGSWRLEAVDGALVPVFEEGATTVAMERGYHLVLDEPDLGRPGVLAYVNNVSAPGRTAWVRRRDGRLAPIEVHPDFRVWVTENGMRELGREEHGRDFLRRFVPYHFGSWTAEEITGVLAQRFETAGGRVRWRRRDSELMAAFHIQARRLAEGIHDAATGQAMPPLGSGVGQRIEYTPRSVLRLAQRLVAEGELTPWSLVRAIRSEYILPLAETGDRELLWKQARAVFAPLARSRGWNPDSLDPRILPEPTPESISAQFLDGRPLPDTGFVWTRQALRVAEEILTNRALGIDVMLLGDAGEGKTELPRQIAELLGVEYFQKTVSSETDEEDLVGGPGRGPNGEVTFVPDIVTLAAERGGVLHLDEYLLADTGRLESVMNPLMDDARAVFLKNPYRRVQRNGLSVILTSNPPWEFQDRHEHSAAAMSRVAVIYLSGEFGMQAADRLQIMRRWADAAVTAPQPSGDSSSGGEGKESGGGSRHGQRQGSEPEAAPRLDPEGGTPDTGSRSLIAGGWRAAHAPEPGASEKTQHVVDLDPDLAERFHLPQQLVFDLKAGRLLEISETGDFVPLQAATVAGIARLSQRLTRQTQVEMGLATGRVFKIEYGLMTGHRTHLLQQNIQLDIADMLRRPYLAALGIGKHEWAHATIDRPSARYDAHEPGRLLANVIGDPRMNEYFASLREDFRTQMESMTASCWPNPGGPEHLLDFEAKLPHEQFADGIIYSWIAGEVPAWVANPEVRAALDEAWPLVRPAFTLFPASPQAQHVDAAAEAFYRIVDSVWPIYERLIPQSQQELIRRLENGASPEELKNPASPGGSPGGPARIELSRAELEELAAQILDARAGALADRFEPQDPQRAEERRGQIEAARSRGRVDPAPEAPSSPALTSAERREVERAQEDALQQAIESDLFRRLVPPGALQAAQRLRRILPPENPTYLEGHFSTGKRVDRRKAVQDAIAPVGNGRVMLRRLRPGERNAAMVILSDVSHSMVKGGAVDNSLQATAAAVYLCEQLGIEYGEILFAEEPVVAKALGGPLRSYARKNELLNRKRDAFGGGATNIRDSLALGIEWLRERSLASKTIVLITDGEETVRDRTRKSLSELEAEAEAAGIHVVALAMGDARDSVPTHFKHYRFASANGGEIPDQIVELIGETHRRRFPR